MKTYKQFKKFLRDKCWNERDYGEGIYDKLIYDFLVEEVEEKTEEKLEYKSINEFCILNGVLEEHRAILNTFLAIEHTKANSILEKLREELEKVVRENIGIAHVAEKARCNLAQKLLKLLTSLETKEIENPTEESAELQIIKGFDSLKTPQPQFTPGQMIEVSNDGEKWEKREFAHTGRGIALADKTIYFYTTGLDPEYNDGRKLGEGWKFARPIKIEPELPEVPQLKEIIAYSNDTELALIAWAREMTTFIQSLARQKPTK